MRPKVFSYVQAPKIFRLRRALSAHRSLCVELVTVCTPCGETPLYQHFLGLAVFTCPAGDTRMENTGMQWFLFGIMALEEQ